MNTLKHFMNNTLRTKAKLFAFIIVCSISIMTFCPTNFITYGTGMETNIRGYVVDENDVGIIGATIKLLSGIEVVATSTSNQNGRFSISGVQHGTYTISISQVGYVEATDIVNVQSSDTNIGTTVLSKILRLSTSTLSIIASPGEQIQIPFTLGNSGEDTETVEFSVANPAGWHSRILTGSYEVTGVSLSSGQTLSLQIVVNIPSNAPVDQENNITITARGVTNETLTFTVLTRTQSTDIQSLSLYSTIISTVAYSGEKLVLPFTLTNIGEELETVEFSVSTPQSWFTRILNSNGRELTKVSLSEGTTMNFDLELVIPLDHTGDTSLTLTAEGNSIDTLKFNVNVEPVSESILFCQFPGKRALPGDPVEFQVELNNPFDVAVRFIPLLDSVPSGWTASIKTADEEYVTEIILAASESVALVVEAESPSSAITGTNHEILVNAEADNQIVGSLSLIVSLLEPEVIDEIILTTKFPEVTVEAGKVIEYQINLANLGEVNRLLLLDVEPPVDWKAVFKSGTSEISQLNIGPASMEDLTIEITAPSTVSLDTYYIPVQVKSESGAVLDDMELKATIIGSYNLYLSLSTLLTSTTIGESTSCTATLTNTGFSTLSVLGLEFEAEGGWDIKISPSQVDLLRPQESYSFDVVIETPKDTVAGDYLVTLTASSDQAESNPMQLRVSVNTSTSWGIYGFGIAIVIIIALVLVFRKFKRR